MGPGFVNRTYVASRMLKSEEIVEALLDAQFTPDGGFPVTFIRKEDCGGLLDKDSAVPNFETKYHRSGFPLTARMSIREYIFGSAYHDFGSVVKVTTNLPLREATQIIEAEKKEIPEQYLALMSMPSSPSG
jgi:hypothetical protein